MTVEVKTSGTTWTVPTGVTSADFECYAGGEGGYSGSNVDGGGAPGGMGGGYAKVTLSLTPGQTVYMNIGAGSAGSTAFTSPPVAGGATWVNKTTNAAPSSTADGAKANGGYYTETFATQVGTVKRSGGAGGSDPSGNVGSGGGGAGGSSSNGSAGTNGDSGGAAGAGGGGQAGAGGHGATSFAYGPGEDGYPYGGGGGGGFGNKADGKTNGGDAGNGCVVITYTAAATGRSYGFISC